MGFDFFETVGGREFIDTIESNVPDIKDSLCSIADSLKQKESGKKTIRVKYLSDKIEHLSYIGGAGKSNWIDLRAAEDVKLKKGEFHLIKLGIAMELPEGYEAHIAPRSSTFKNFHIIQTNSVGVVDHSYCGNNDEWMMPVLAMEDTEIHVNDRVCQFRIERIQPEIAFKETDDLGNSDRGGIGSTGKM